MTQLSKARAGETTPEMKAVAEKEQVDVQWLRQKIAVGRIIIPANINRKGREICGIGEGLSVKVNANIGTSSDKVDMDEELAKLRVSVEDFGSIPHSDRDRPHIPGDCGNLGSGGRSGSSNGG
jgi:phosphomethylpyrimidine synthase